VITPKRPHKKPEGDAQNVPSHVHKAAVPQPDGILMINTNAAFPVPGPGRAPSWAGQVPSALVRVSRRPLSISPCQAFQCFSLDVACRQEGPSKFSLSTPGVQPIAAVHPPARYEHSHTLISNFLPKPATGPATPASIESVSPRVSQRPVVRAARDHPTKNTRQTVRSTLLRVNQAKSLAQIPVTAPAARANFPSHRANLDERIKINYSTSTLARASPSEAKK
jgi:hypothetical protein